MILRAMLDGFYFRLDQNPASPNGTGDRIQFSLPTPACNINSQASRYQTPNRKEAYRLQV